MLELLQIYFTGSVSDNADAESVLSDIADMASAVSETVLTPYQWCLRHD
jgi:hypothetical protein